MANNSLMPNTVHRVPGCETSAVQLLKFAVLDPSMKLGNFQQESDLKWRAISFGALGNMPKNRRGSHPTDFDVIPAMHRNERCRFAGYR
ncbi:hypothetical protein OK016_13950 [Vibrio chagasii]|nr:hypothetical protein [Vibrio chagasii]